MWVRRGILVLFIGLWMIGLGLILLAPFIRLATFGLEGDDLYGALLLTFSRDNHDDHPYFYADIRLSFRDLVRDLPETATLQVLFPHQDKAWIWAYPRIVVEVPDAGSVQPGLPVITTEILPDRDCQPGGEGLSLCR
jgi:hypothetical protein